MKLAFFDDYKLGLVVEDTIVDVSEVVSSIPHLTPGDLLNGLVADFENYKSRLETAQELKGKPIADVTLRAPHPKPNNIVAMAVNYMEDGTRAEPAPINAFHKSSNAVIGNNETIVIPDVPATIFEHEAELALVIGKRASNVKQEDAYDYIFGYLNFIDVSARGLLPPGNTFYQMKSRDTFAPMGPWIVTADEIQNPQALPIKLWVNGELKQNFNSDDMAHKIPRIIEWVTSIHTLEPGDIVATGTNHGGLSALMDGDQIDMEIDGLGSLHLYVQDDLKRTWSRETRLDRSSQGLEGTTPQLTGKYSS
ncbi:MAG: fumarylacetoacetate hydrolase family protein [Chloroflexota bacterium]|nr:fumarylacetoacetate hydrolase family protein [Chloroflexota bacterium]